MSEPQKEGWDKNKIMKLRTILILIISLAILTISTITINKSITLYESPQKNSEESPQIFPPKTEYTLLLDLLPLNCQLLDYYGNKVKTKTAQVMCGGKIQYVTYLIPNPETGLVYIGRDNHIFNQNILLNMREKHNFSYVGCDRQGTHTTTPTEFVYFPLKTYFGSTGGGGWGFSFNEVVPFNETIYQVSSATRRCLGRNPKTEEINICSPLNETRVVHSGILDENFLKEVCTPHCNEPDVELFYWRVDGVEYSSNKTSDCMDACINLNLYKEYNYSLVDYFCTTDNFTGHFDQCGEQSCYSKFINDIYFE